MRKVTYRMNWTAFKVAAGLTYEDKRNREIVVSKLKYSLPNFYAHLKDALVEVNRSANVPSGVQDIVISDALANC